MAQIQAACLEVVEERAVALPRLEPAVDDDEAACDDERLADDQYDVEQRRRKVPPAHARKPFGGAGGTGQHLEHVVLRQNDEDEIRVDHRDPSEERCEGAVLVIEVENSQDEWQAESDEQRGGDEHGVRR